MLPVTGELTYGLERIAMYLQGVESVYDLVWQKRPQEKVSYGDVYHQNEVEMSTFNFVEADVDYLLSQFEFCEKSTALGGEKVAIARVRTCHESLSYLNLLDARHAIGVTERQRYILRVRTLARAAAEAYVAARAHSASTGRPGPGRDRTGTAESKTGR